MEKVFRSLSTGPKHLFYERLRRIARIDQDSIGTSMTSNSVDSDPACTVN